MNILLVEDRQLEHPLLDGLEIDQCDNVEDAKEKLQNGEYDALIFDTVIWHSRTKNYLVNIYKDLLPWYYTKIKNKETRLNLLWTTTKDQIKLEKIHKETYWVVTAEKNSGTLTIVLDILEKVHTGQEVGQIENVEIGTGKGEWSDVTSRANAVTVISDLKHCIAHLFLSMDVDLQGIGVLRNQMVKGEIQNAVNTPKAYLRDVLNNKKKTYYRQKLADLQFFVAKVSEGEEKPSLKCDAEPCGDPVRPTLSKSNLPNDKAIVGLISEEKRNDDSVRRLWSALLNLSGLKANDANPFENINPGTDSSIFEFMCLMDCKVDKKNDINEQDVNDVMKIEGGKVWTVEGANPSPIKCFNDWFCALVDCLEKLSKVIKSD